MVFRLNDIFFSFKNKIKSDEEYDLWLSNWVLTDLPIKKEVGKKEKTLEHQRSIRKIYGSINLGSYWWKYSFLLHYNFHAKN